MILRLFDLLLNYGLINFFSISMVYGLKTNSPALCIKKFERKHKTLPFFLPFYMYLNLAQFKLQQVQPALLLVLSVLVPALVQRLALAVDLAAGSAPRLDRLGCHRPHAL